jgi:DNA-binding transcriptional LysR family regulator
MSLTEAGQQLFDTLQPSLGDIEQAVRNLGDAGKEPSGLIRVNTSRMAAKAVIEPHLAEFYARYPKIGLEFVMAEPLSNIIAEGCDAGIRLGRSLASHVVAVPVTPAVSMAVVGTPAHFERHGVPGTPADLARHNCINYRYSGSGAIHDWDFNEPGRRKHHFTQAVKGNLITCAGRLSRGIARLGFRLVASMVIAHRITR